MKILDTSGMKCPQPLILLKKELRNTPDSESFKLITLSKNSLGNIKSFLTDNEVKFTVDDENGKYVITITGSGSLSGHVNSQDYCENSAKD